MRKWHVRRDAGRRHGPQVGGQVGLVGMDALRRHCYAYYQDGTDRSLALARVNRLLSVTRCQMDRPTITSILAISGFSEGVVILIDETIGGQTWILSLSTTCRELRGLFRLWRWAIVDQAIVRLQELEAGRGRL